MTNLQQAAKALLTSATEEEWYAGYSGLRKALDDELAQSVEPYAVFHGRVDSGEHGAFNLDLLKMIPRGAYLYLHQPQPQATTQAVPLTDDQVINAMCEDGCERIQSFYFSGPVQKAAVWSFARAIEAALLKAQGANQ